MEGQIEKTRLPMKQCQQLVAQILVVEDHNDVSRHAPNPRRIGRGRRHGGGNGKDPLPVPTISRSDLWLKTIMM